MCFQKLDNNFQYTNESIFGSYVVALFVPASISFVFRIILLLSHSSLVRLKQKLTVAHMVSVMRRQCLSNCTVTGKLVLTKKQKQSRVFPLAAASTHTLTRLLNLNLDCPFFVFSLCVQVPLGLRPKLARERNYIKIYGITKITVHFLQKQFLSQGEHMHE